MIEYATGDIIAGDAEALVNSVNCVGVMGRGVALQFKQAFPDNFRAYAAACRRGEVQPGKMFIYPTGQLTNPRFIVNFPTKRHWRGKSRIEDIESGLEALACEVKRRGIRSIAIPPLGSGLGGLKWSEVKPRIEKALSGLEDVRVIVFEPRPADAPIHVSKAVPNMTPGRASLVGLIDQYLRGLMDPFVTLLEVHKLLYFMQEAGEPLRLRFTKALYGPYAENLRHVLHAVEGHLVSGYAAGGDAPDKQIELVPGAVSDALAFLSDKEQTRLRFERVSDLVQGFESPFGLELLSTVHWVATHDSAATVDRAIIETYGWSQRKRRFSKEQIERAYNVLNDKRWLVSTAFH